VGTVTLKDSKNGRFCLNNNWSIQSSNFFSDNDGETNPIYVSSIQVRNYAMSAEEIRWLGKAKAKKIEHAILADADLSCPQFTEDPKQSVTNNTISLTAHAGDLVNYKWEMNNGSGWQNITGTYFRNQASSSLHIYNAPELLNGYRLRCIAYNDCQTISNEYLLKDIVNSNRPFDSQNYSVMIYPNPSPGNVTIDLSQTEQTADIRIFTTLGVEVYKKIAATGMLEVKLSPGAYLFHIRNNKLTEVKKILIVE
jgi:hypothetical protein